MRNNRVRDSEIRFSFGFGIYLDDASNRMTVERNLVHGLQRSRAAARGELGLLRHPIYSKGIGNVFRDNVVADNGAAACFGSFEMAGEPCRDLTLERNVFADSGPAVYSFQNWSADRFAVADRNLFYDPDGSYLVDGVPGVTDLDGWRSHSAGHDRASLTADPRFMDARHGDFRLRHDSPAWTLGIEPVDLAAIGLQPEHPFADPDDAVAAVIVAAEDGRPFVRLSVGETVRFHLTVRSERGFVLDPRVPGGVLEQPHAARGGGGRRRRGHGQRTRRVADHRGGLPRRPDTLGRRGRRGVLIAGTVGRRTREVTDDHEPVSRCCAFRQTERARPMAAP